MIEKSQKQATITKFANHEKDTGSPEVQIALLSARIKDLTEHFKAHKKDFSGLRGMKAMVERRKRLLTYVRRHDEARYQKILREVGIRK